MASLIEGQNETRSLEMRRWVMPVCGAWVWLGLALSLAGQTQGPTRKHVKVNARLYPVPATEVSVARAIRMSDGRLFAGTNRGVYQVDLGYYHAVEELPNQAVEDLRELEDGRLGVRYAREAWALGPDGRRAAIAIWKDPPLVGEFTHGPWRVNIEKVRSLTVQGSEYQLRVRDAQSGELVLEGRFSQQEEDRTWIAVDEKRALFRHDEFWLLADAGRGELQYLTPGVPSDPKHVQIQRGGSSVALALGGDGVALAELGSESARWLVRPEPLGVQAVDGEVLIATAGGFVGLEDAEYQTAMKSPARLRPRGSKEVFAVREIFRGMQVNNLARGPQGGWFAATADAGLQAWTSGGIGREIPQAPGTQDVTNPRWIEYSDDGRLWGASKGGLVEVKGAEQVRAVQVRAEGPLGMTYLSEFRWTADGKLRATGEGVVAAYSEGEWKVYPLPGCVLSPKVRSLAYVNEREIWLSYRGSAPVTRLRSEQGGGLATLPQWGCAHYGPAEGYPNVETNAVYRDRDGAVWLGGDAAMVIVPPVGRQGERDQPFERAILLWHQAYLPVGYSRWHGFSDGAGEHTWLLVGENAVRLARGQLREWWEAKTVARVAPAAGGKFRLAAEGAWPYVLDMSLRWRWTEEGGGSPGPWTVGAEVTRQGRPKGQAQLEVWSPGGRQILADPFAEGTAWRREWLTGGWFAGAGLLLVGGLVVGWRRRAARRYRAIVPLGTRVRYRFEVIRLLAASALSQVYVGRDGEQTVVLKRMLRPEGVTQRDFQTDAAVRLRAWEQLSNAETPEAQIVPLLWRDVAEDGALWVAMPYLEAPTLRAYLEAQGGRLEAPRLGQVLVSVGQALAVMHERGIAHGDLKPENIVVAEGAAGPEVTLLDLGSTQSFERQALLTTATKQYMAPEQRFGQLLPASDIFVLALLAYELASGRPTRDLLTATQSNWNEEIAAKLERHLPEETGLKRSVLGRALRFHPPMRPPEVRAFVAELLG